MAVIAVALATMVRWLLDPILGGNVPFITLFVAVIFVSWLGGFGPAMFSVVLSTIAAAFFFIAPRHTLLILDTALQVSLILFLVGGSAIAVMGEIMRRTRLLAHVNSVAAATEREKLLTTLDSIGDGVVTTDAPGRITYLNPIAEQLSGWTAAPAIGRPLIDVFPFIQAISAQENSTDSSKLSLEEVLREGNQIGSFTLTLPGTTTLGPRSLELLAVPVRNAERVVNGSVLILRDTTVRDDARKNQALLAAIVNASDDAIISKTLEGIILTWNRGAEKLFGYSAAEAVGKHINLIIPPELHDEEHTILARLARGESIDHFETVRKAKDGHPLDVYLSISPLRDSAELLIGASTVARDITQFKKQARNLQSREEQLRFVTDHAPILIVHCDQQGRYQFVNAPYAQRFGLAPSEVVGKHISEVIGQAAYQEIREHVEQALTGRRVEYETQISGKAANSASTLTSGPRWMHAIYVPQMDASQQVTGFVAVIQDITQRKNMEDALRQREQQLRIITNATPALMSYIDLDLRYRFVNRQYEHWFHLSADEVLGKTLEEVLGAAAMERLGPYMQRALAGEEVRFESEVPYQHGGPRWIDAHYVPDISEQGAVVGFFVLVTDISDHKRAELALRDSEERLRLALQAGRMTVWDWNFQTDVLTWFDQSETQRDLIASSSHHGVDAIKQWVHPQDQCLVQNMLEQARTKQVPYEMEFRILLPDQSVRWMASKGKVFPESGVAQRLVGVNIDITQRKRAEEDNRFLAEASATLAALIEYEPTLAQVAQLAVPLFADWCAIDMLESDGRLNRLGVKHVDPAKIALAHELQKLLPPDPDATQGIWQIIRTGRSEITPEITESMLEETITDPKALSILRKLGLRSYMGVPLRIRDRVLGVMTFIAAESGRRYDQQDLRTAEDLAHRAAVAIENARLYHEAREADRRKAEFLATLAHELRNPLAPLRNAVELLRHAQDDPVKLEHVRSMMDRQLSHLIRLVDDLLDINRITLGKMTLRHEYIDLADVVRSAVDISRPRMEAAGQQLTITLSKTPVFLHADFTRLAQVFGNLLTNASKYSNTGAVIRLEAEVAGGEVIVSVTDNGMGIAVEHVSQIFNMFSQVSSALDRAQGGLGIGLSLVKGIVEMHGGSVVVQSPGAGHGSTFSVRLPLAETMSQGAAAVLPESGALRSTSGRRVLVVDDMRDAAESLSMMLQLLGHEIHTAHDGQEAIEAAAWFRPEVILLDIGLPKINGYEAAKRIRMQEGGQKVLLIALTGWGQDEDRARAVEAGFDLHFTKPIELPQLQQTFNTHPRLLHSPAN